MTASAFGTTSPLNRAKSAQLKTTRTSTASPWAEIGSADIRRVQDDSPPRICGP